MAVPVALTAGDALVALRELRGRQDIRPVFCPRCAIDLLTNPAVFSFVSPGSPSRHAPFVLACDGGHDHAAPWQPLHDDLLLLDQMR